MCLLVEYEIKQDCLCAGLAVLGDICWSRALSFGFNGSNSCSCAHHLCRVSVGVSSHIT